MNPAILGIASVATGNTIAQGMVVLSSLIVARFVMPAEFGSYAAITAATSVLGVLSSLRLELAVPIPEDRREADHVLEMTVLAAVANTLLFGAVGSAMYWAGVLQDVLQITPPTMLLALLSIALIGMFNGLNQMALRERRYRVTAARAVAQALVVAITQIALVAVHPSMTALLAGQVIGQTVGLVLLARAVGFPHVLPVPPFDVVRKFRAFPLIAAPSAVVNTLGLQLPLIMGTALWGTTFAGWFGMTQRLLAIPVTILGGAIGQVFIGEFSSRLRARDERLAADLCRASLVLALASSIVATGLMTFGPSAFAWGLGEEYRQAGIFARALAVGLAAQLLAGPLSVLLPLLGKQVWQGAWDVSRLLATVAVFWGANAMNVASEQAMWFLGGVNAVLYLVLWFLVFSAVRLACAQFPATDGASMRLSSREITSEE